eukprot:PITA_28863
MSGDFNMIKLLSEKKGGTRTLSKDSIAFQNFIDNMKLVDTDMSNGLYTCNNRRGGESQVASKLDRFIISEDLMLKDREMIVRILPFGGSDHWPVQLEVQGIGTPKNKPFRFENIWLTHLDFINNIAKWWIEDMHIQGTRMFLLHKRLKHIKLRLKDWNKNEFGNIFEAKNVFEGKMQELNQALSTDGFDRVRNDQVTKHHQDWENLCKQEEIFWRQKSRVQWLKEGEETLSFSTDPPWRTEETILDRVHFVRDLTKHIPKIVTREDNFNLNRLVTKEEVSEVIKEMPNGKAPGLDGFNVDFFKACWKIVKQDILNVVEDSQMNKTILKVLNTSFISLIPK